MHTLNTTQTTFNEYIGRKIICHEQVDNKKKKTARKMVKKQDNNGPEKIIDIGYKCKKKSIWKKYMKDVTELSPFTPGKVYEDDDSIDTLTKNAWERRAIWRGTDPKTARMATPSIAEWHKFFGWIMHSGRKNIGVIVVPPKDERRVEIKKLIMNLACTDPRTTFKNELSNDGKHIRGTRPTRAWAAAVKLLGCNYDLGSPPEDSAQETIPSPKKQTSILNFGENNNKAHTDNQRNSQHTNTQSNKTDTDTSSQTSSNNDWTQIRTQNRFVALSTLGVNEIEVEEAEQDTSPRSGKPSNPTRNKRRKENEPTHMETDESSEASERNKITQTQSTATTSSTQNETTTATSTSQGSSNQSSNQTNRYDVISSGDDSSGSPILGTDDSDESSMGSNTQDSNQDEGNNNENNNNSNNQSTLKQTRIATPKLTYTTRFDIRFRHETPNENPNEAVRERIKKWWTKIREVDRQALIIPWKKDDENGEVIEKTKDIPSDMNELRKYFSGINPSSVNPVSYAKIRITTDVKASRLTSTKMADMNGYYYLHKEAMYERQLQDAESTTSIGFLTYSGGFTDIKATCTLINKALKQKKITVGGRLKDIVQTSKEAKEEYKNNNARHWTTDPWRAVVLETEYAQAAEAVIAVSHLFNKDNVKRPGGLRFRFVPDARFEQMSDRKTRFVDGLIDKHRAVLGCIKYLKIPGVKHLDDDVTSRKITLRKFLMKMKAEDGFNLIQAADMSRTEPNDLTLHVFPEHLAEATKMATTIVKQVEREVSDRAKRWFTPEKIATSANITYNHTTKEYDTPDNNFLEDACDDDFPRSVRFEGITEMMNANTTNAPAIGNRSVFTESGSIGSRTARSGILSTGTGHTMAMNKDDVPDDTREAIQAAARAQRTEQEQAEARRKIEEQNIQMEKFRLENLKLQRELAAARGADPPPEED